MRNNFFSILKKVDGEFVHTIKAKGTLYNKWLEELQNFGCNSRVMQAWNYKYIEQLIKADKRYGIKTPEEFIGYCKQKGYSGWEEQLQIFDL